MPDITMLIKPASSLCNLRCRYCFYHDEADKRDVRSYGIMDYDTLDIIIKRALNESSRNVTFSFQGGEPTVAGIDFFLHLHEAADRYKEELGRQNIKCHYTIQTNGILAGEDDSWIQLFRKHHYLVGLSVDGTKDIHDTNRVDPEGRGTFMRVVKAADKMKKAGVDFNILTVISAYTARHIEQIYNSYKKRGWYYMQFIPCMEPLGEKPFQQPSSLTPEKFLSYSKTAFDLWYDDNVKFFTHKARERVSVRRFDNLLMMAMGQQPESCGMRGMCSIQFVIESNGGVYPCDFYVLDDYYLGNIRDTSFKDLYECERAQQFIKHSIELSAPCRSCSEFGMCAGGCARYSCGGKYIFCEAEREFDEYSRERFLHLAQLCRQY